MQKWKTHIEHVIGLDELPNDWLGSMNSACSLKYSERGRDPEPVWRGGGRGRMSVPEHSTV